MTDDDLRAIRRALHVGPPSTEVIDRSRALLASEMRQETRRETRQQAQPRPRKDRWGLGALLTGGLAALMIAAFVAIPALHGTDRPTDRPETPQTAQELLLAAAERAQATPGGTGRYWHVKRVSVAGPVSVGGYDLVERRVFETWTGRDPADTWFGDLSLGFRPRTEADERAWKAAGAPTSWTVPADNAAGSATFTSGPGQPQLTKAGRPGTTEMDVDSLPTDPAALRVAVLATFPDAEQQNVDGLLFGALGRLLLDTPARPAVRAAAFRLMAQIPGVTSVGAVKDGDGRTGTGVELVRGGGQDITSRHLLIIDPTTNLVMALENAGTEGAKARPVKASSTVILIAEWTDAQPTPPTAPN